MRPKIYKKHLVSLPRFSHVPTVSSLLEKVQETPSLSTFYTSDFALP